MSQLPIVHGPSDRGPAFAIVSCEINLSDYECVTKICLAPPGAETVDVDLASTPFVVRWDLEYQSAEPDVGINGGWTNTAYDAPEGFGESMPLAVWDAVSELIFERTSDAGY